MPPKTIMPRYVVLEHRDAPRSAGRPHWDLMLEFGPQLRTWALDEPPQATKTIAAEALPAHRLDYLDYEGPISGGRGSVSRYCTGKYQLLDDQPDCVRLRLIGTRLQGLATLCRYGESLPSPPQPHLSEDLPAQRWTFSLVAD